MFITRFFVPGIALAIITIAHIGNYFGMGVPDWLVSPVINAMILSIAVIIAVIGFKIGWWILVAIGGIAIACVYVYFQYEINIITIMPDYHIMSFIGGFI